MTAHTTHRPFGVPNPPVGAINKPHHLEINPLLASAAVSSALLVSDFTELPEQLLSGASGNILKTIQICPNPLHCAIE